MSRIQFLLRQSAPRPVKFLYRSLRSRRDAQAVSRFLTGRPGSMSFRERASLIGGLYRVSYWVECPHRQHEILAFVEAALALDPKIPGCLVEAGCYKGGSTAKFSLAARATGRQLVAFDSFEGIPPNDEPHERNIFGRTASFPPGSWRGGLEEVQDNVRRFGEFASCEFVKGWFDQTMPGFSQPVAAAYIDVDLASSTQTCIKYLWPLLAPGGVIFSQDGHLPLVIDAVDEDSFWENEVGCAKPVIEGLRTRKLLRIVKPTT